MRTVPAREARETLPSLLDDAAAGKVALILRRSRPAAALMPPEYADVVPLVRAVLREFGESLLLSRDADVLAAYRSAREELDRGDISWLTE